MTNLDTAAASAMDSAKCTTVATSTNLVNPPAGSGVVAPTGRGRMNITITTYM